ncbi:hypothetical protein MLD38_019613 [Melastoma candidum]|nr:hypothetical protein MLD38_019613 [Melastoma candidum]
MDVCSLADVIVGSALAEGSDALSLVEVVENQMADPGIERPLDYCAELHILVVKYIIPQAIQALNVSKHGFASYCLSDAGDQADACTKALSGTKGSPVTDHNKTVRELCDVADAIIKLFQKG